MTMKVEFWSDIVCPWCYIGKRRFEKALSQFEHQDQVEVTWRSFELDPSSALIGEDIVESLTKKFGRSTSEVKQMTAQITALAAQDGLEYRFDLMKSGNSFDAHRLLHLSVEQGLHKNFNELLYKSYFTEGMLIGDIDSLKKIAAEAGLDSSEVNRVLESDAYADKVRDDEARASSLKVSGVPFVLVDEKYAISGAQSADVFLETLRKGWIETHPITMITNSEDGNSCEGGNCII